MRWKRGETDRNDILNGNDVEKDEDVKDVAEAERVPEGWRRRPMPRNCKKVGE